jgi:DNA-binding LacI/PurR family transcriptional regulator
VTLKTVAERVGVSAMTVSNAFSRPDQLSPQLRERILAVADELGYAGPDPAARSLARGTTGTVGILRNESAQYSFTDEYSTILLAAVAEELGRAGLALTLLPSVDAGPALPARDVAMDGAIVDACSPASAGLHWLRRRGLPLVQLDQRPEAGTATVNVDDRGGAAAAARHLLDLGHRRIALVTLHSDDDGQFHPARERLAGWFDALRPAGVEPVVLRAAEHSHEAGTAAVSGPLTGPDRPTAVLAVSDSVAGGVLRAAEDVGLQVPRDLSVVGFDDVPLAVRLRPELTTVRQDIAGKGRAAAAALVEAIARQRAGRPPEAARVLLPAELVVRGSTARPPAGQ